MAQSDKGRGPATQAGTVIGWDIGGAHLKAARAANGRIEAAIQVPCALWMGIEQLEKSFATARVLIGECPVHAATMTGELADVFPSRREGVRGLAQLAADILRPARLVIYAGRAGFVEPSAAADRADDVASANWHASATLIGRRQSDALFVDMGSTTTDLVPIAQGVIAGSGYADAERLAEGELVYSGLTRTALMAVSPRAPFKGRWLPLMNEHFATMADVHRVLGTLPQDADQHATADGRDKSLASSLIRLARMVGCDARVGNADELRALASWFAEAQLRTIEDAGRQILSRGLLARQAPLVGAGIGRAVIRKTAARLKRDFVDFDDLIEISEAARPWASACAPAAAVALLAASDLGKS